jgi:hypothetical protein
MANAGTSQTGGIALRGYRRSALSTGSWDQYVVPVDDRIVTYAGRASTFLTPGRGAAGQKILALHNATGSAVRINVNRIRVDLRSGTIGTKVLTTLPPIIRIHRFTAIPASGTVLAKTTLDSGGSSNPAVQVWGDASANGTSSATTLAVTIPSNSALAQVYGPRILGASTADASASGYEVLDSVTFFEDESDIVLRALEGICVFLDQSDVAGNVTADQWAAVIDWQEYTQP